MTIVEFFWDSRIVKYTEVVKERKKLLLLQIKLCPSSPWQMPASCQIDIACHTVFCVCVRALQIWTHCIVNVTFLHTSESHVFFFLLSHADTCVAYSCLKTKLRNLFFEVINAHWLYRTNNDHSDMLNCIPYGYLWTDSMHLNVHRHEKLGHHTRRMLQHSCSKLEIGAFQSYFFLLSETK